MRPLASGRDAEVFSHGDGLVLRRYRDGRDAGAEAQLLVHLGELGYPVPEVVGHDGPDIVMTRIAGPTMARAIEAQAIEPSSAGQMLAELQRRLHDLTRSADDALLHLDMHPANVLIGQGGPVVIDWCNARRGSPGFDVAVTALILAQVIVTPGLASPDPAMDAAIRGATPAVLAGFAGNALSGYVDHLDQAMAMRRQDRYQSPTELELLPEAEALARSAACGSIERLDRRR